MNKCFFIVAVTLLWGISASPKDSRAQNSSKEVAGKKFSRESAHGSKRDYLKSLRRPFVDAESGSLGFFNQQGRLMKRISLGRDSFGYSSYPLICQDGAVIIKSTGGYEWTNFSFEFYAPNGSKTAVVPGSTGAAAVSPKGNVMIVAHQNGQYHFSGGFSLHNAAGDKIANYSVPDISGSPGFSFSQEGRYGVILTDGYRNVPQSKNRVLLFSETGDLVSRYETKEWSVQAPDLEGPGPLKFNRLARIDEANRVVVGEGFESATLKRITFALDFNGTFLWRRNHRVDANVCPSTMVLKPKSKRIVVADFCDQKIDLTEIAIRTGAVIQEREIRIAPGQTVFAAGSTDGDSMLITFSQKAAGSGEKRTSVLVDSALQETWREVFANSGDEARYDVDGNVLIRRGGEVQVGKFK